MTGQKRMLVELFIENGVHTVPLTGELKRLPSGKKSVPHFETDWKSKYAKNYNEKATPLAGALTGAISNIMAVDCDNEETFQIFRALDPDYTQWIFKSKDKPEGGGTIIYRYDPDVGTFKFHQEGISLDFFSDEGFVYLPTEDNHTKETWAGMTELPPLKNMPSSVKTMLKAFKVKLIPENAIKEQNPKQVISNRLAPMLANFVKGKTYDPILFRVLTPHSFRDLPSYVTRGHLHPNDVPEGRGSEYLSKVSAILGADISVDIELYFNVMTAINGLWETPMEKNKLHTTIINPMIEGRATIDGEVIWQYDEHWDKMGFIATTLNGNYIETFYDDVKALYYLINYTVPYVKTFNDKRPLITTLRTLLGRPVTEAQYDTSKQLIRTLLNPSLEFGHVEGTDYFNLFRQTPALAIINNPEPYKSSYTRPTNTINYIESLVPDDTMRSYLLSFLRTKFTTFNYSPVILYFIGKPGSGKDTLVQLLSRIIGMDYVTKPDTRVFLEQFNGWMIDKYFIQLDEYGNKLVRSAEKQEVLGKLKAYTGSSEMQIRAMRMDGYNYNHCITFILTANSNPLPLEIDDRRVCYIKTPNKLKEQEWVKNAGGMSIVYEKIKEETLDFCYYLATEVKNLKADDYNEPPQTEDKEKLILANLPAADMITYFLANGRYEELADLAVEYDVLDFKAGWERDRLMDEQVQNLYTAMTEGHGSSRAIIKQLKGIGLSRQHSTRNNQNIFFYQINELHQYADREIVEDTAGFAKHTPRGLK